ncbi:MAG: hypothetical protein HQL52_00820 [Magnetococcales bacterium]|nr:hypothetical protein [Magnetococcales bacterium]
MSRANRINQATAAKLFTNKHAPNWTDQRSPMEKTITTLERLFEQLNDLESLESAEIDKIAGEWNSAMEKLTQKSASHVRGAGDAQLRERLTAIMKRLPDVQEGLEKSKSQVARQIFAEKRRFNTIKGSFDNFDNQGRARQGRLLRKKA